MARAKKERAKYVAVIESLDQEGRGVARRDGKVVFIEGALPGEKVEYEVYRSKPSFELGLTTEIYKESPLRVLPKCPHFGVKDGSCGGCAMQHLEAHAQVAMKQKVLMDALWHIGKSALNRFWHRSTALYGDTVIVPVCLCVKSRKKEPCSWASMKSVPVLSQT